MAFFNANIQEAAKVAGGSGNYVSKSGIYDVTIKAVTVEANDKGARSLSFFFTIGESEDIQRLYSAIRLENNDGSASYQAKAFHQLLHISDLESIADPIETELPIGKDKAPVKVLMLEELCDVECKLGVKFEYSVWQGNISEKKHIVGVYRADGAHSSELLDDSIPVGTTLEKDLAYADKTTYRDGLTEEDVSKWIADGRPKNSNGTGASAKPAASKPSFGSKKPGFGQK